MESSAYKTSSKQRSSPYVVGTLRADLIWGLACIAVQQVAFAYVFRTPDVNKTDRLIWMISGTVGLAGIVLLARSYYEGVSSVYNKISRRGIQLLFGVVVVLIAWSAGAWYFSRGAWIPEITPTSLVTKLILATILGTVAYWFTDLTKPKPRIRAYLTTIALLTIGCMLTRSGEFLGGEDDQSSYERPSTDPKDSALLNFILYSSGCSIGIAVSGRRKAS